MWPLALPSGMTNTRCFRRTVLACAAIAASAPAGAQLLSEQINETSRTCVYYGTQTSPDGQVSPLTVVIGLGQECPAVPPYRDVNAPVPPNAQLTSERTNTSNRFCFYSEAGIEYQLTIDLTLRCAMTPALMQRINDEAR